MSRLGAVGWLAAVSLFFPCSLCALQMTNIPAENHGTQKMDGTVYYDGNNQPAANIMVEVRDAQGDAIAPVMTSESGGFRFGGLNGETYSIVIHVEGYEPVTLPVDLSYGSIRGLAIYLKSASSGKTSGPGSSVSAHELSMPAKARDLVASGKKKLYEEKNAKGGLEDFQQAVAAAPGFYEAYYLIGMSYLTLQEQGDAEKSFRKSIELSGDKYAEAEVGLGALLLDEGNYSGGEKLARRGIELNPTLWLGHYELGRALLEESKIADAEKSAEEARALAPSATIVYRLLSVIHLREKKYDALLEDLDAYIKLDPNSMMGAHAQQLRMQVQEKIAKEKDAATAESKR